MKNIDLTNIYSLSLKMFTILKEEYSRYLSNDKLNFLENLDIFNFYKIVDNKNIPPIYYMGDKYYINSNFDLTKLEKIVPFLCLSSLCSNLNPLKIGMIEEELLYLKDKYKLNITTYFYKELEVSKLISKTILLDVPFKIIFKESDSDIVNYLTVECGSPIGICYLNTSKKMKEIKNNLNYFVEDDNVDYSIVIDYIYDFISYKIR